MKAAVLHEYGADLAIENITLGPPGHNEVRVAVRATGLCHTDLHFMRGHLPINAPADRVEAAHLKLAQTSQSR